MRPMAGTVCAACLILALPSVNVPAAGEWSHELVFSTYAGGTGSTEFPTKPGVFQRACGGEAGQSAPLSALAADTCRTDSSSAERELT